jgi:hypothetical protein
MLCFWFSHAVIKKLITLFPHAVISLFLNQVDLEDQLSELRAADENAKRAMGDAARLAEELRREQEHGGQIEKLRRGLEAQVRDATVFLGANCLIERGNEFQYTVFFHKQSVGFILAIYIILSKNVEKLTRIIV